MQNHVEGGEGREEKTHLTRRIIRHKPLHRHAHQHQRGIKREVQMLPRQRRKEMPPQGVEERPRPVRVVEGPHER